ncbi:hypothetical protein Tco_1513813 [Tanacetum coccineum]
MLPRVHHPFLLWEGCSQAAKSRYNTRLAQLLPKLIYSPCVVDWNILNQMGCGEAIDEMLTIKLFVAGTNEEIFTSEAWTNAFNIDEPIYSELCHEFYSTYEFDEVCADDELKTKKIIKFKLCGRAFSWTLLEFAKRLGLYHSKEIEEKGFDVYFQGGLRSDEHLMCTFKVVCVAMSTSMLKRYDKMQKNNMWLLSMFEARHQNGYVNVAWLIARWMKRKGAGSQKESMICYGQFITKISKRKNLLSGEVLNSLSAPIHYRALDTTTLRELIDSEGRLVLEAPEPGVPRVTIPRSTRASMQDLYERMGSMEIHQGAIERMYYRQYYQWDMYAGVFEHMAGVTLFYSREPITHLDMISSSMTSIISSTHLSSSQMMMSSVEMTRVGCVTACFGSRMF